MGIFANKQVKKAAISPMPVTAQADAPKVQAAVGIGGANSVGHFYQYQEGTARNRAMSLATVSRSRDLLASVIACMPLQMYNEVFNDSTGEMEQVDIAPRSWLRQPDPTVTYNFLMAWTLDDLLTSTAGGVIRAKSQGAVQQLVVQNVAQAAFPMLQYLDTVQSKRTGVSDASQGLDPAILQNVTAAAVASMQQAGAGKIELMARIFAETGVKSLFQGILHLLCKYQDKARMVRMRGEFVEFDPRTWANQYDVSINVGLGGSY